MASSANDGGVGGKFRRRPFRKAPATPYDRPQAAIRRVNPNPNNLIGGNNGWISKIVDPASRIIARGASKFFASVFQKRLTGPQPQPCPPPPPPEENLLPGRRAPEAACNNLQMQKPSEKAPAQKGANGENVANLNNTDGCQEETISVRDGFIELEQLLKKKTFTRVEFDRLTDLLRSRTVEPSTSKQPVDYEKKEETMVAEEAHYKTQSIVEPSTSQLVFSSKSKEKIIISEQEDKTKSSSLHRNVKDSVVTLRIGGQPSQIPEEEAISPTELAKEYMGSRPSKVSPSTLSLRSQILQEDTTLSTEPYSKKLSMALLASRPSIHSSQIAEHSDNGYMTPRPRGRSALYKMSRSPYFNVHKTTNIRGGRPVRYGLASSSMSSPLVPLNMLPSGEKVLKRGSAVLDSDVGSFGPTRRIRQKSDLMSPSGRHSSPRNLCPSLTAPLHQDVNERSGSATQKTFAGVTSVPPQSTEMARKIFLELDKLVPSPREKLSENKASGSPLPSLRNSISPKHDRIKDNSPSENASAVKATDAVVGMGSPVTPSTDVRSSRKIADTTTVSDSAAFPSKEEPAFQMSLAESLEWGAKYNMASASRLSTSGSDKPLGKSVAYPSKSIAASSSMLKGDVVKASDRPASEKRVDFMLSPASALGSQPSLTPAIPPSLADSPITKKEISASASKSSSEGLSTTTAMCGAVSLKVDASATTAGIIESPGLDNGGKTQKADDFHRSFENATTSGSSTSTSAVLFTSGACIGPSQSNGSLTSFSSFPVSAGSAAAYFSDISTTANSSTQSVSVAQPIVASTPSFQFGSGTSGAAPISFPVSGDKSDAVKTSPFAISSSIAPGTSNAFSNTNITGSSPATSSVFSNIGGISSAPAMSSSLLLNAASGSSLLTTSSAFPSPTNGISGFSASAQSSASLSFATNSFSNSGSHFVGTAGSTIGAQPPQLGIGTTSFPNSAVQGSSFSSAPTFGLNSFSTLNSVSSPFGDATSVSKIFGSHAGFSYAAAGSSTPASIPSFPQIASSSLFSSNTQQSPSPMLPSTLGSNPSLPSTGFVFESPAPSGKTVGASSGPVFSFLSARTTTSAASPSPAQPVSNIPMQGAGFDSSSPGDDRMNVEDAMVDDSIQASGPSVTTFGQPANSLPTPNLPFGSPAAASGGPSVFQFGSNQNSTVPQNSFQSAGSFEFSAGGGSFSLGSGAGDKSGRRIVRVKRDKHRKK